MLKKVLIVSALVLPQLLFSNNTEMINISNYLSLSHDKIGSNSLTLDIARQHKDKCFLDQNIELQCVADFNSLKEIFKDNNIIEIEKIHYKNAFGGLGFYFNIENNNILRIKKIIPQTPAFNYGLKENDIILKINDINVAYIKEDLMFKVLRGEVDSEVKLTIFRNNNIIDITLIRDLIKEPSFKQFEQKFSPQSSSII